MKTARLREAHTLVEPLEADLPVEAAVAATARARTPAILESSLHSGRHHRFSIFAADPIDEFVLEDGTQACPFSQLANRTASYPQVVAGGSGLPFCGGWIGFFTYEAGLAAERVAPAAAWDVALPRARFFLYDTAAVFDHTRRTWALVAVDWPDQAVPGRPAATDRLSTLRRRLLTAQERFVARVPPVPITTDFRSAMTREAYFRKVAQAKQYIEAGDIYQVNLSQRFTAETQADPLGLYQRLRRCNPSSHAAFLPWQPAAILSSSPELFLELRGRHVVTRPIKGTRPRSGDAARDADARRALMTSPKERAELTMIVDLLRNDLGRVCDFGSVRVLQAREMEEHPTVFHQVATIEGALRERCGWTDLLCAAFPGGSITGAPKIRAMQIISELETTVRGVYCGTIGLIGLDGSLSLNIAIRTMVQTGSRVHIHAGGAIIADSVPSEEYEEMMAKAAGMMSALGCGATGASDAIETCCATGSRGTTPDDCQPKGVLA